MTRLALLLAAAFFAAGCAAPAGLHVPPGTTVELDAFSGRPNPTWTLADAERTELKRRLAALPRAPVDAVPDVGLGYRGFRITIPAEGGTAAQQIYVTHGLVRIGAPGDRPLLRDVHGLEAWLRAQARREGLGGVLPGGR
jgi:hypothetical protein